MDIRLTDKEGNDVIDTIYSDSKDLNEKVNMLVESLEAAVIKFKDLKQLYNNQAKQLEELKEEIKELKQPQPNFWSDIKDIIKFVKTKSRVKQIDVDLN